MSRITVIACLLVFPAFLSAQRSVSNDPSAASLVQKSIAALSQGAQVRDVTLMGTARRIAGSDDETGGVIAKALQSGEARVDFNYTSGQRSESRVISPKGTHEQWSGPDGVRHAVVSHNVAPDSPWFSPPLLLQRVTTSANATVVYAGSEMRGGSSVEHLTVSEQVPAAHHPAMMLALLQKAARFDLYLDSNTNLPSAVIYNAHPDNNLTQDIPVEIHFSDYRPVDGVQVPFHVQKYFNRMLVLDLQFSSAVVNSGLSANSLELH
jgi:hypothetical protein